MRLGATPTSITRTELYARVWITPMRHLAKEFGFSDVGLAKLCKRHDIPTPPLGYWSKVKHGKRVSRPELPVRSADADVIDLSHESRQETAEIPFSATFFDSEIGQLAEKELHSPPIVVANTLRLPHEVVIRTQAALRAAAKSDYFRNREILYPLRRKEDPLLDVAVGRALMNRALRICDALLKACEKRGYQIRSNKCGWKPAIQIDAFGESFEFKLREITKRGMRELTAGEKERLQRNPDAYISNKYEFALTGNLRLELGRWLPYLTLQDGKRKRVEDGLNRVMIAILRNADEGRRNAAEAARKDAIRLEHKRKQKEAAERKRRKELKRERRQARITSLIETANAWRQSQYIREFLGAKRLAIIERDGYIEPAGKFEAWFEWAERIAESIDPLRELRAAGNPVDATDLSATNLRKTAK